MCEEGISGRCSRRSNREERGGIKDKRVRARARARRGTWPHLTRSYSPLNIGSDVDVYDRRRRAQNEAAIKPEVYFNIAPRRAVQSA